MSLLGLRPRVSAERQATQPCCVSNRDESEEISHARHHLREDLRQALQEATRHGRRVWMRFAVLETDCGSLSDELGRCAHKKSHAVLFGGDASQMMEIITSLVKECDGLHLTDIRDIYLDHPQAVYVKYEVEAEPGFQLPPN